MIEVKEWTTDNGGHVIQWKYRAGHPTGHDVPDLWVTGGWSHRLYVNSCGDPDCMNLVTAERRFPRGKNHKVGRWPTYCDSCRGERFRADSGAAAERMRKHRAKQNARRDENYRKLGRPIPEPGKRGRPKGSKNFR